MKAKLLGFALLAVAVVAGIGGYFVLQPSGGPKVLVLNSYHDGHPWSDGITAELRRVFQNAGVALQVRHLGLMYTDSAEAAQEAGRRAKQAIDAERPDLVVTIDDPAVEHVIAPYYRGVDLPVVFAGLDWDAGRHGLPASNVTGMVEKNSLFALLDVLRQFSGGASVGLLAGDTAETRHVLALYEEQLGGAFDQVALVSSFREWKSAYQQLQDRVDVLYVHDRSGIADWDGGAAVQFVHDNAVVPSGSVNPWMAPLVLFVFGKDPGEHGAWAANSALDILNGLKPSEIQVAESSRTPMVVNSRMARTLLIDVPVQLIEGAPDIK